MLNNTLSLGTGELATTIRRFEEAANRTVYIFPDHSQRAPHTLTLYRTLAQRQGSDLGRDKRAVKLTVPQIVKNAEGVDIQRAFIAELSVSTPVGAEIVSVIAIRQQLVSFIMSEAFESLVTIGEI